MGWTRDALDGLARLLADAGVGTYRESGAYQPTETGITVGLLPQQPAKVIALVPYPLTDDPSSTDSVLGLQVRTRSDTQDPRTAFDLADSVFDALHGLGDVALSATAVLKFAERTSGTPLGEDSQGRAEWSDNYQLRVNRPAAHRI